MRNLRSNVMNSIVPLYLHARNKPGMHVMLKVDSGPGRMNLNLLARLRCLGSILYPCVPNTMHVTQETDCYMVRLRNTSCRTLTLYAMFD